MAARVEVYTCLEASSVMHDRIRNKSPSIVALVHQLRVSARELLERLKLLLSVIKLSF